MLPPSATSSSLLTGRVKIPQPEPWIQRPANHYNERFPIIASYAHTIMTDPTPRSFKQYFRLPLDQVDEIQSKRGEYILYYMAYTILYAVAFFTRDPENILSPFAIGIFAVAIFIYWKFVTRFARVLRLMTYPAWMRIPACVMPALPLPGLIVVVIADRRISENLTKALDQLK